MASALKNLSDYESFELKDVEDIEIGIVVSDYHKEITYALYEGCVETLQKHGIKEEHIHTAQVPGTFELPVGAKMIASGKKVDAVICIGCVIKGETPHNDYINNAVAIGLSNLGLATGKPFVFGVLTPNTMEQAKDRAGGKHGNKGVEAAVAALRMLVLKEEIGVPHHRIGFS